jgi:selenocysteine lyase/cysteine desulfurase
MARFEDDLYVDDEIYQSYLRKYWKGKRIDAIHFNHASITAPLHSIHQAALKIQNERLPPDSSKRLAIIEETRDKVAALVNLEKENVVFANNTTDAASLVFWLVGLAKGDSVITTDAENESIPRIFKYYMDHANPGDGWVSWQNFAQYSNQTKDLIKKRRTGIKCKTVEAYGVDDERFLENLLNEIDKSTRLVVFCHVLRENGRIMPIMRICQAIHELNPRIYVLVDGAQCLGTLPEIDFREIGCDFYVATPHKTLCSETVGLLFFDPKHLNLCQNINDVPRDNQITKKDQFEPKLAIRPNSKFAVSLPEIYALSLVVDYYRKKRWVNGNDFSTVNHHLRMLKQELVDRLYKFDVEIVSPVNSTFTNFICSFRFPVLDNRDIVRGLWNRNIFTSYIFRSNVIRTSFSITNSLEEIGKLAEAMREITKENRL